MPHGGGPCPRSYRDTSGRRHDRRGDARDRGPGHKHLYVSSEILLRLVSAAHTSHPEWVIEITERRATNMVEAGQSSQYELATLWLENAALAFDAAGRCSKRCAWEAPPVTLASCNRA